MKMKLFAFIIKYLGQNVFITTST